MMLSKVIDRIRTRVWLQELRALSGLQATHALASHFDPESTWKDVAGVPHQSKWYRYASGDAIPSKKLTNKLKAVNPDQSFDIHHPTWSLLRKPKSSKKTIDRLIVKMPVFWREILTTIKGDIFSFRRINLDLVNRYKLTRMNYLDALLLFELARRHALLGNAGKSENLTLIILALPLIYTNDPLWSIQDSEEKKSTLKTIIQSLKMIDTCYLYISFPRDRLVQGMAMQDVLVHRYLHSHPRALKSHEKRVLFLTKCLDKKYDEQYSIAMSAFIKECEYPVRHTEFFVQYRENGMLIWKYAWERLKEDPKYSHFANCLCGRTVL